MSKPNESFYNLGIAPDMLKVIEALQFVNPTPIQSKAIPIALEGKDIMGIAQTGTGKTMAFGIPTVQRLASEGGLGLILVPTRELATQVKESLFPLLRPFKMKSAVLIGGVSQYKQIADLRRNPDIIIATPGRLNDLLDQGKIRLDKVATVILDEADHMFDMGFEPQVKAILERVPNKEQTLLFSATMPSSVVKLATQHMKLPITVEIASPGTTTKDISQELFIVPEAEKKSVLKLMLEKYRGTVLVFARTKIKASRITKMIRELDIKAAEIHSNRSMGQRKQAIEGFKRGRYRVLVATDIAARGIDVSMIELVINYDLPDDAESYVHRIGRTGRAGQEGHAITFATPIQSYGVGKIETLIKMSLPRTEHPEFANARFDKSRSEGPRRPNRKRRRPSSNKTRTSFKSRDGGPKGGRSGSRSKSNSKPRRGGSGKKRTS